MFALWQFMFIYASEFFVNIILLLLIFYFSYGIFYFTLSYLLTTIYRLYL